MDELMQRIAYYENLIDIKNEKNSELNLNHLNNLQLCRSCLKETTDDDVDIGNMCVMDVQAGGFLYIHDVLQKLIREEIQQDDILPSKVCLECVEHIKTFYYFSIQVGKAQNILKLLAQKLKTAQNNVDAISIKNEEIPKSEEFLIINQETSNTIEEDAKNEPQSSNCHNIIHESPKDLIAPYENNEEIFIKEEQELIINDVHLNEELDLNNEILPVENIQNNSKEYDIQNEILQDENDENDQFNDKNISNEIQLATPISNINQKLYSKLPKILDNKCLVCQEIFNSGLQLVDHAKQMHPRTKVFKCRNCSVVLPQISSLYRHNRKKHSKILSMTLKAKVKQKSLEFFENKCAVCKKLFNAQADLIKHALKHHPKAKTFKCRNCSMISSNMDYLRKHFKRFHENNPNRIWIRKKKQRRQVFKPSAYFDNKCAVCQKMFYRKIDFIKHAKQFHPKVKAFKCRDCCMHFSFMNSLIRHNRSDHKLNLIRKKHVCEFCSQSCYSKADLKIHLRIHTGERPYACPLCEWTFTMKSSLTGHLKTHVEKKPNAITKPMKKTKTRINCKYCGRIFEKLSVLKKHLRKHTDERPYKCAVCEKTFKYDSCLRKHHKSIHLEQAKNREKYKRMDANTSNENAIKSIENKCGVCNKIFKFKRELIEHGNLLHPNVKVFKCPRCEDVFKDKVALRLHVVRHHKTRFNKYQCEYCSKIFLLNADLKCHLMVHTGERPFPCSLCKKSYIKKSGLNWHIKKVHQKRMEHECELCLKNFKNLSLFERHLRVHTGDSTYTCSLWKQSYDVNQKISIKESFNLNEDSTNSMISEQTAANDMNDVQIINESEEQCKNIVSQKDFGSILSNIISKDLPTELNQIENSKTENVLNNCSGKMDKLLKDGCNDDENDSQKFVKEITKDETITNSNTLEENEIVIELKSNNSNSNYIREPTYKCNQCENKFFTRSGMNKHIRKFHPIETCTSNECRNNSVQYSNSADEKDNGTVTDLMKFQISMHNNCLSNKDQKEERLKSERIEADNNEIIIDSYNFDTNNSQNQQKTPYNCIKCKRSFNSLMDLKNHKKFCDLFRENENSLKNPTDNLCLSNSKTKFSNTNSKESIKTIETDGKILKQDFENVQKYSINTENSITSIGQNLLNINVVNEQTFENEKINLPNTSSIQTDSKSANSGSLNALQFKNKSNRSNPIELPQNQKENKCKNCHKTFKSHKNLVDHMKKFHTSKKRGRCQFCPKFFTSKSDLNNHLKVHNQKEEKNHFSCSECRKSFNQEDDLKNHKCKDNSNLTTQDEKELIRKKFLEMINSGQI